MSHDPRTPLLPDFHIVFPTVSRSGISNGPEEALLSIYPACKQSQDAGAACPTTDALTLILLPEKKVLQISPQPSPEVCIKNSVSVSFRTIKYYVHKKAV